jgi:hypothetical protein
MQLTIMEVRVLGALIETAIIHAKEKFDASRHLPRQAAPLMNRRQE